MGRPAVAVAVWDAAMLVHDVTRALIELLKAITAAAIVAEIPVAKPVFKAPQAVIMVNILDASSADCVCDVTSFVCSSITLEFKARTEFESAVT